MSYYRGKDKNISYTFQKNKALFANAMFNNIIYFLPRYNFLIASNWSSSSSFFSFSLASMLKRYTGVGFHERERVSGKCKVTSHGDEKSVQKSAITFHGRERLLTPQNLFATALEEFGAG